MSLRLGTKNFFWATPFYIGASGNPASPTPHALQGQPGTLNIYHSNISLVGSHISIQLLQLSLRDANKLYRNSEFEAARDIYVFIHLSQENSSDAERRGFAHKAAVMLVQMAKGEY